MRLEPLEESVRVFFSPAEYDTLLSSAPNKKCYFASRIEAECSPRVGQVAKIQVGDFYIPSDPEVDLVFLQLRGTKDTTEGENALDGQCRITWVPEDLHDELMAWAARRGLEDDDELFDVSSRRLQQYVVEMRQDAAAKAGDEDFLHVTSHDFRVYYATNMVRRLRVDIEIVMEMGGWGSKEAIEPYLQTPLPREIQDELVRKGVVSGEGRPEPPRRDDLRGLFRELRRIRELLELDETEPLDGLTAERIAELRDAAAEQRHTDDDGDVDTGRRSTLTDFGDDRATSLPPGSRLAERLHLEHAATAASDVWEHYPPSPARATALAVGLLSLATVMGVALASSGTFWIDLGAGEVHATPGFAIGLVLASGAIFYDLPDL